MVDYIKTIKLFRVLDEMNEKILKRGDFVQNNFRVLLAKKRLKITDVAEGTGLSRNTIRALYYETAKGIQFQTLQTLCIYLNCEVGELFELEKEAV